MPRLKTNPVIPRHHSTTLARRAKLIAQQRANQVIRYQLARQNGMRAEVAAKACGESMVTLWRYKQKLQAGGIAALIPATHRCGRHSLAESSGLTSEMISTVRTLAASGVSHAWKAFAELPECPPKLAAHLRRFKTVAPSLVALIVASKSRTPRKAKS